MTVPSLRIEYGVEKHEDGKFWAWSQLHGEDKGFAGPFDTKAEADAHNQKSFENISRICERRGWKAVKRFYQ